MALVNMCNFSEDIKDIFLQKNGFHIIMQLLNSKDEDVVVNVLKLMMTLIAKNRNETNQIGRTLAEEEYSGFGPSAVIKRLLLLVKKGPNISHCKFSKMTTFLAISLLRALIQHSSHVKPLIVSDKEVKESFGKDAPKKDARVVDPSFLTVITSMIGPNYVAEIDQDIENAILSLLIQIVREEIDNKKKIGHMFITKIAGPRMKTIIEYVKFKEKQDYLAEKGKLIKFDLEYEPEKARWHLEGVEAASKIPQNIIFNEKNELKFLTLISILLKNCEENLNLLKKIKTTLNDYINDVVTLKVEKFHESKDDAA